MQCSQNTKGLHSQSDFPDGQVSDLSFVQKGQRCPMRNIIALLFAFSMFFVSTAQAGIITSFSTGELSVQFSSIDSNITVSALDLTILPPTFNGTASGAQGLNIFGDPNNIQAGDIIIAYSTALATSPPDSDADTFGAGLLSFSNSSLTSGSVSFNALWNLTADTTSGVTDPADFGFANVSAFLLLDLQEQLNGGSGIFTSSNVAFGGGAFTSSGSNIFNLTINPGETLFVDLGTQSQVFASSAAVPEPSSITLMSLGALGLFLTRRRWMKAPVKNSA